jgi:hypothetical protein
MPNAQIYFDVLTTLGYPCTPYNGDYLWQSEIPDGSLVTQVETLPDNLAEFLATDLTEFPSALQAWQCDQIRELRRAAYNKESDGLKLAALFDGTDDTAWRDKVKEIKARYPWPGAYRGL